MTATELVVPESLPVLVSALTRVDGIERRACSRALQWWRELAAPRGIPSMSAVTEQSAGDLWPNLFILECAGSPGLSQFVYSGQVLRSALGHDAVGRTLAEIWPQEAFERACFLHQSASELLVPIDEAGRWSFPGEDIVYRCLLMPLSDDQRHASHLLGAFSFRRFAYA